MTNRAAIGLILQAAARRYKIPENILKAVAWQESTWDPYAVSFDGGHGKGVMQIDDRWHAFAKTEKVWDAQANIDYGARFLASLYKQYLSWPLAVERYNGSGLAAIEYRRKVFQHVELRPWARKS